MVGLRNSVRRETVEVTLATEALAFALQPRLADLNRRRLLPAIERVLDELAVPGRHVRIDRLELDLGAFSLARLEDEAEDRLVRELRRSVGGLLRRLEDGTEVRGVWLTEAQAQRELLELYLLHGTLPHWATERRAFSLEALVLAMAGSDAEGLLDVIRAIGRHDYVLERIAAQLSDGTIRQLIRLLEPRHAALILDYVDDLEDVHRVEPLLPLSDRELGRVVWVLVEAYLVQDPGSQFNRKSFVKSLLEGLAASEGLEYAQILGALRVGLEWTERRQPLRSSLPAVVAELVREWSEDEKRMVDVSANRARGNPLMELVTSRPAVARSLLRAMATEPESRRAVVRQCPEPLFDDLLEFLRPREAEAMKQLLQILNRIPAPYRPRPEDRLRQVLFDAVLGLDDGAPLDETFYAGVLGELFAWPLAEPVSRFLLEVAAATGSDGVSVDQRESFRAAVAAASRAHGSDAERPPSSLSDRELRASVAKLFSGAADDAAATLRRQASDWRTRERWAAVLSEEELVRIAEVLEPQRHRVLLAAAEVLAEAWRETAPPGHPALTERRAFWSFMLERLAREPAAGQSVERLVAAFFEHSAARYLAVSAAAPDIAANDGERLLERAGRLARTGGHTALLGIFRRDRRVLLAPWEHLRPSSSQTRRRKPLREISAKTETPADVEARDSMYIENAGLVLAAPFLPQLFQVLDFLIEHEGRRPALRDSETASRAIHLLQFLVDGRTCVAEPLLVLNKILCGVPTAAPIEREIELTEREREVCETLLRSVIAGWKVIEQTSVAGLQESFFQREGKLQRSPAGWKLEVQRKTIDFLVDEVPWNRSVILLRWMPQPLYVSW